MTIRRLNRAEYNNTVRDLVGVTFKPADDFPSDDVGSGFDNQGDVLSLPTLLLEKYLSKRSNLAGLVLIMDARRPFTKLDHQMIGWFAPTGKPIHCLLTKADKLTRQEQARTLSAAKAEAAKLGGKITLQLFSSLKKTGMDEAEAAIGAWLDCAADSQAEPAAN